MEQDLTAWGVLGNTIILLSGLIVFLIKNRNNDKSITPSEASKLHERINSRVNECNEKHSKLDRELGAYGQAIKGMEADIAEIKTDVKAIRKNGNK